MSTNKTISRKLADVQVGRKLELAATDKHKATTLLINEVQRFESSVVVKGTKFTKGGKPYVRVHEVTVEPGEFQVVWENEAAAEVASE